MEWLRKSFSPAPRARDASIARRIRSKRAGRMQGRGVAQNGARAGPEPNPGRRGHQHRACALSKADARDWPHPAAPSIRGRWIQSHADPTGTASVQALQDCRGFVEKVRDIAPSAPVTGPGAPRPIAGLRRRASPTGRRVGTTTLLPGQRVRQCKKRHRHLRKALSLRNNARTSDANVPDPVPTPPTAAPDLGQGLARRPSLYDTTSTSHPPMRYQVGARHSASSLKRPLRRSGSFSNDRLQRTGEQDRGLRGWPDYNAKATMWTLRTAGNSRRGC